MEEAVAVQVAQSSSNLVHNVPEWIDPLLNFALGKLPSLFLSIIVHLVQVQLQKVEHQVELVVYAKHLYQFYEVGVAQLAQ